MTETPRNRLDPVSRLAVFVTFSVLLTALVASNAVLFVIAAAAYVVALAMSGWLPTTGGRQQNDRAFPRLIPLMAGLALLGVLLRPLAWPWAFLFGAGSLVTLLLATRRR
ncbi:hypothetical protein M3686_09045 [Micrococcus luteus]|uniref:hypothetical protein n=1 Tax=Micrococcus luteus TaxID=1270 RepID=UPI00203ACA91|nr:hypothetical protein [Micrococcus luteus]MCM3578276.1 hypothetical protein [Micrococcus luteus]